MTGTSKFNEQMFEEKLVGLKDTQDAISAMSSWCLQHKEHHKKIVACWLHCLKRVKIEVRLSLFYLANDVIQYSKRKHLAFVDSWATALQKATPLVRDDKVRNKILRIFKIWEERTVYDEAFLSDLGGLLTTSVKKKVETEQPIDDDFQPSVLIHRIKAIKVLGDNTDAKFKRIKDNKLPLSDADRMRLCLKDRRHGSDIVAEVENGVKKMEAFVKALETEISSREKLLDLLRQATLYYENQRGEAKVIAYAYKKFGNHLKSRSKAVTDLTKTLSSPVPSPDVNAPSPSPDSDLETKAGQVPAGPPQPVPAPPGFNLVNSSFIGSADFLTSARDVFSGDPASVAAQQNFPEAQAIEVISTNPASSAPSFDVAEFFKSLMPNKEASLPPPPIPPIPLTTEWSAAGPWDIPPPDTPQSPPHYDKVSQVTHLPIEYDDSIPVPPVPDVDHRTMMLPQMDIDCRIQLPMTSQPPPGMTSQPPPGMTSQPPPGMTSQPPPGMTSQPPPGLMALSNIPRPQIEISSVLSERGALIAPTPSGILIPPPPPPVKALKDVDRRNLISLTASPGALRDDELETAVFEPPSDVDFPEEDANVYPNNRFVAIKKSPVKKVQPNRKSNDNGSRQQWLGQEEIKPKDIVESVDMDVSDGEDESHRPDMARMNQDFGAAIIQTPGLLVAPPPPPPPPGPGSDPRRGAKNFGGNSQQFAGFSSSAGAKLIPPESTNEFVPAEENGDYDYSEDYPPNNYQGSNYEDYSEPYEDEGHGGYQHDYQEDFQEDYFPEESPRGHWRSPRARGFPYMSRPRGPFRGRGRFFRPRGRTHW